MKNIFRSLTKNFGLLVLFMLPWLGQLQAQSPPYRNTGISSTGSNTFPFNSTVNKKTQLLYRPGDLGTVPGGVIDTLWFRNANSASGSSAGPGTYSNLQVRLGQFASTVFPGVGSTTFYTPAQLTTVLSLTSYTINQTTAGGGWYFIPLTTPFLYDPALTLVLDLEMDNRTSLTGFNSATYNLAASPNHQRLTSSTNGAIIGTASAALADVGLSVAPNLALDATVQALLSPTPPLTIGQSSTISISLQNRGTSNLVSATVGYQIDNNAAVTESWTGSLGSFATTAHTFATPITIPNATSFTIKTWVTNSNGLGADGNSNNDTLTRVLCTLYPGGTYTIGGAGATFESVTAAINAVSCGGVAGPITFNINAGTYYGTYQIPVLPGTTSNSMLTFKSTSGVASDVVLMADTAATASNRSHFIVNHTARVSFQNLTFIRNVAISAANQACIVYGTDASGDVVSNVFEDQSSSLSSFNNGILHNGSNALISNNSFIGFWHAVLLNGGATTPFQGANQVINNSFTNYVYRPVYALNQNNPIIRKNTIQNFVGTSTVGAGIWLSNVYGALVHDNVVSGGMSGHAMVLFNLNADPAGAQQNTNKIYNNVVNGRQASSLTSTSVVFTPISVTGSFAATASPANPRDAVEIVNNTVYAEFNSTSTSTTQGGLFFSGSSPTAPAFAYINVRNNHFEINPLAGGSLPSAFRLVRFASAEILDSLSSNNNNFRLGGTTPLALFRLNATSLDYLTLTSWQAATGKDINSLTESASFLNSNSLVPTSLALDNKGVPISYVQTDITGATRNATTPDIGAYEFVGAAFSNMSAVPLGDTIVTASRTFDAQITDSLSSIVAGTARVFYKKGVHGSWAMTLSTGNVGSTYAFNIDHAAVGGVVPNDTIYYYLAVQNAAGLVTTLPLGGSGLALGTATAPPSLFNYVLRSSMTGTYTIGQSALADFTTITLAADFYNRAFITGPVNLVLIDTAYGASEVYPIIFNMRPGLSATNSVKLFPSPNVSQVKISGNAGINSALFILNGTKHFIIDGSKNGSDSRDLMIENNSTFTNTAVINLRSIPNNNVAHVMLKNLHIVGSSTTIVTSFGIIGGGLTISTTSAGDGFNHVEFLNNKVERTYYGIVVKGTVANPAQQLQFRNNEIGAADTLRTVVFKGIEIQNVNGAQLLRNRIQNMYGASSTTTQVAIDVTGTANQDIAIEYNRINGVLSQNVSGWGAFGVNINAGTQIRIINNEITNIRTINYSATSNSFNAIGIRLVNNVQAMVSYNSVNVNGAYTNTSTAGAAAAAFAVVGATVTGEAYNNIFNVDIASTSTGPKLFSAVWFPTPFNFNTFVLNNNAYYVADNADHLVGRQGGSTTSGFSADLTAWRTVTAVTLASNDDQSIPLTGKVLAPFTSNNDLSIPSGTVTLAESGGRILPALGPVNYDVNDVARPAFNGTAPDMGAHEFAGVRPILFAPLQLDSLGIDPDSDQCFLANRSLAARFSTSSGVARVTAVVLTNGTTTDSIPLVRISGTSKNGMWAGTIPAALNSGDERQVSLLAIDSIGDSVMVQVGTYEDLQLVINAGPDQSITIGDATTLTATSNAALGTAPYYLATRNTGGNGSIGVTFNITALNNIQLDTLLVALFGGVQGAVNVFVNPAAITAPPTIDTANGWLQLVNNLPVQVFNTTTAGPLTFTAIPLPGGVNLLAGQTYGFYVGASGTSVAYTSYAAGMQDVFTDGNISIATGPQAGYGGPLPNPVFHPRMFNGAVAYTAGTNANIAWHIVTPAVGNAVFGTDTTTNTTTSYPAPYGNWFWGSRHQMLLTPAELAAQGLQAGSSISGLGFDVVTAQGVALQNFSLRMGHSNQDSLLFFETTLQEVFNTAAYVEQAGINMHAFNQAFLWDGISSIVIESCFNNTDFSNNAVMRQSTTAVPSTLVAANDAPGVCSNNLLTPVSYSKRPNIILAHSGVLIGNGPSITVQPSQTTTYRAYASQGACTVYDDVMVTVTPPNNYLNGFVRYANSNATAINNVQVYLINAATNSIYDAQQVSNTGEFLFSQFPNGTYYVSALTARPWGGVNATDALAVGNHFISALPLTDLPLLAADVNGSSTVNSTDALGIVRRFVGLDNSFPVGDWVFETLEIAANGLGMQNEDLFAICYGDVNGTFQPLNTRVQPQIAFERAETNLITAESSLVPVRIDRDLELGALSIVAQVPVGLQILEVRSALGQGQFDYQLQGQELRISWFSTQAIDLKENDVLFYLELAAAATWEGDLQVGGLSEAANGLAEAYPMVNLRLPALRSAISGAFEAVVYPNPANDHSQLQYRLPEAGKVSVRVTDALGRVVLEQGEHTAAAGTHQLSLETQQLAAGTYHVQLSYQQGSEWQQKMLKLQVVR